MKEKITFGKAMGLAIKETGYKLGLVAAVLIVGAAIWYLNKNAWAVSGGEAVGLGVAGMAVGALVLARPASINADPVAAGYKEYTNE